MKTLDKEEIKKILPHREPMLLIDRVVDIECGKRVIAIKEVVKEDQFFKGHFHDNPIMPGTMIVEAMAQTSILLYHSAYEDKLNGKVPTYYLGSVKAHFFHSVVPGNELRIESETVRLFPGGGLTKTKAYVKTTGVAEAELVFIVK